MGTFQLLRLAENPSQTSPSHSPKEQNTFTRSSPMKSFTILLAWILALGLLCLGCRKVADDPDHGHTHEPKTAQITVWTDRYEIFAEHRAPVAGKPATFITHVTDLRTLEPRREGMVKFILRQGASVVEHPQAAPARPGIYLPGISFPKPGDWTVQMLIPSGDLNLSIDLGIIKVYPDQHSADHATIPDAPEGVSFLKEQQWKILSKSEPSTKRQMVERLRVPARVKAKPGFNTTVLAPLSGQLASINGEKTLTPGRLVSEGQLLALLKPNYSEAGTKVIQARADLSIAEATLEQSRAGYTRIKQLAEEGAKSQRELQEAELHYRTSKARHAAVAELLETFKQPNTNSSNDPSINIELRAPIAGVLNGVEAGPGEVVSANQPLFGVLNLDTVWIEAMLPEGYLVRLGHAKDALLELPEQPGRFIPITGTNRGHFLALGLEVDLSTRRVPMIYETTNKDKELRIGQNVTLHIETSRTEEAIAIPVSALVEEGDQLIAFVQISGETFEKREIKAGIQEAGFVQVLDGIKEGERVVTKGAYAIRLSSISGVIPAHGHSH